MKVSFKMLLAAASLVFSLNIAAQQQTHTVQQGETLYGIARKYGTTIDNIIKANPGIGNGDRIVVGQKINIPQKGQAATTTTTTPPAHPQAQKTLPATGTVQTQTQRQEPATYSIDLPKKETPKQTTTTPTNPTPQITQQGGFLNSGCKEMYHVKKKDNLYRIALQYNLTVEEIVAANPELTTESKIKKDSWICIPFSRAELQAQKEQQVQQQAKKEAEVKAAEVKRIADAKATSKKHLNVAVILPLKIGGDMGIKMIEFYRGMLMATDSLKQQGISSDIYAYHSGTTASDMMIVLTKPELKKMDIIIGPAYADQISALSNFCMQNKVRLVTPFSTTNTYGQNNPYIYQASINSETARKTAANKVSNTFNNHQYVILNTNSADDRGTKFTSELSAFVTAKGQTVQQLNINGDDEAFKAALNQFRDNLIIPDASSLTAATNLTKKLQAFKKKYPEYKITLIGYPEWPTYNTITNSFYALDTYVYSTFYRDPSDARVTKFEAQFKKNFAREIQRTYPRYGIFGFDVAYFFMNGLAKHGDFFDEKSSTLPYNAIQNGFSFNQANESSAHVNQQIILIHYTPTQKVEIIK